MTTLYFHTPPPSSPSSSTFYLLHSVLSFSVSRCTFLSLSSSSFLRPLSRSISRCLLQSLFSPLQFSPELFLNASTPATFPLFSHCCDPTVSIRVFKFVSVFFQSIFLRFRCSCSTKQGLLYLYQFLPSCYFTFSPARCLRSLSRCQSLLNPLNLSFLRPVFYLCLLNYSLLRFPAFLPISFNSSWSFFYCPSRQVDSNSN